MSAPAIILTADGPRRLKADGTIDRRHLSGRVWTGKGQYKRTCGQQEHRLIVELRTGIKLPETAVVHHVDRHDRRSNRGPFVVCQDAAYHGLIEARTRAWEACGNANWEKCRKCGRYDDPANMQSKEYEYKYSTLVKHWHYRFKNRCVDKDFPVKHTRDHTPRKRRHVAPWRLDAERIERERAEAFRALLAFDAPTLNGNAADVCACGSRVGKRFGGRYFCIGCGAQKRAGFVSRSAGTPNRSECPLSPLGPPPTKDVDVELTALRRREALAL